MKIITFQVRPGGSVRKRTLCMLMNMKNNDTAIGNDRHKYILKGSKCFIFSKP